MSIKCGFGDCNEEIFCTNSYKVHIKVLHTCDDLNKKVCTYKKCRSQFLTLKNLLRHLSTVHNFPEYSVPQKIPDHDVQEQTGSSIEFSSQSTVECSQQYYNEEREESSDIFFDDIFLTFLMDLHTNSMLTKDTINSIFKKIKENILDKLLSVIEIDTKVKDDLDVAYEKFNTQYKFEKQIEKRGFLSKGNKLT